MRGVSEVVAISLLVAMAVLLAMGFIYWGSGFYSQKSAESQDIFRKGISNAYADVDIINATWYSGNKTVYVAVKNTGGVDLTKVYVMAGVQIGYFESLAPGQTSYVSFALSSKPEKVIVSAYEGASDEQLL
ncbi:MAG: archaellin/type IV pilin N-terminal domain-containing protein [archaeon]